jgi:hypothetical protein
VSKTVVLSICSFLVALTAMYFFRWVTGDEPSAGTGYDFLWEKVFVSAVVVFSFAFGLAEPKSPWRWPLLIAYVHYFSGFFIMRFWGQIPPFELVYITLLALPGVLAGYLGSLFRKKRWVSMRSIG